MLALGLLCAPERSALASGLPHEAGFCVIYVIVQWLGVSCSEAPQGPVQWTQRDEIDVSSVMLSVSSPPARSETSFLKEEKGPLKVRGSAWKVTGGGKGTSSALASWGRKATRRRQNSIPERKTRRRVARPQMLDHPARGNSRWGGWSRAHTGRRARSSSWMGPLPSAPPTPVRGQRI